MSIYTGLNVSLFLNDVNNANESLRNGLIKYDKRKQRDKIL